MADKYSAIWVSHSSISDFVKCPRTYFIKHVYRDPKTNHKIKLMSPSLALGQAVHDTLESLSVIKKEERFGTPLMDRFEETWKKVSGLKGGFTSEEHEYAYKKRGQEMVRRVYNNPGPIKNLSIKLQKELPWFWLSEEDNLILCGRIDWLEYIPTTDTVHIIDFKTGKRTEDGESLQLPIYYLLVDRSQKRKVSKASYWYLEFSDSLTEVALPDPEASLKKILEIARKIKLLRQLERLKCNNEDGCGSCEPYERLIKGEGEFVAVDEFGYDTYVLKQDVEEEEDSIIL